jgi:hypothetical protein
MGHDQETATEHYENAEAASAIAEVMRRHGWKTLGDADADVLFPEAFRLLRPASQPGPTGSANENSPRR